MGQQTADAIRKFIQSLKGCSAEEAGQLFAGLEQQKLIVKELW